VPSHNLPGDLSSFVGREREIPEVIRLLGTNRLLTLTGVAGVGKTRLALRIASEELAAYPDGVWLVELAPVSDPGLVTQVVATALGIREQAPRALLATMADVLRSRAALLLLDNCEHLVEACAELASVLLRGCPYLRILATSRQSLGIAGEIAWSVPPLSVPSVESRSPPEELARSEAVRLFVERARTRQQGLTLADADLRAVAEVCRRLDGLPLAIELAAARLNVLSPAQIAMRLEDRYRLLTGGSQTGPPRHQTLGAAIAWSYDLLSPPEQVLFRRLAVFAGGWTLEAAERICAGDAIRSDDVLDLLGQLVDKSLVIADAMAARGRRYRVLETIREYAAHKLRASGEEADLKDRHAEWFLDLAERAESAWRRPDETEWLDQLEAEIDNLRAAVSSSAEGGGLERALRLVAAAHSFWLARGSWQEGRTTAETVLALAGAEVPRVARAKALQVAGNLASWQGDDTAARALLHQSLELYRAERDDRDVAAALVTLGVAAQIHGDQAGVVTPFAEALALGRKLADEVVTYRALYHLGEAARQRREYADACAMLEESQRLSERHGDSRYRALSRASLGRLAWMQGDHIQAAALHRDSLRLWRARRDPSGIAISLEGLAWIASAQGRARRATRLFGAVEQLREASGYPLPPPWRNDHEWSVEAARNRLGPAAFRAAWAAGRALSLQDAMAEAIEAAEDAPRPQTDFGEQGGVAGPLSRRERAVAELVAQGCTNRQIASQLVITEATAAKHIEHILDKLGLGSRAQVAVWAAQRGLLAPALE
jgi:predicted ATPase/DNA-binding CsgD family transcriptional regulator